MAPKVNQEIEDKMDPLAPLDNPVSLETQAPKDSREALDCLETMESR